MATLQEIRRRAEALARKYEAGSITPGEVGQLFIDLTDYTQVLERDGSALGIRKVYTSVAAMRADKDPQGDNGKPLHRGNLVAIYDKAHPDAQENGLIYVYTGTDWTEIAHLKVQLGNAYTDEEKGKVALIKTDAGTDHFLAGDGTYKPIRVPQAPVQSISVGGTNIPPDAHGNVDLTIPKAPVQGVSVNGKPITPSPEGIVDIETKSGTVQSVTLNGRKSTPDESGNVSLTIDEVAVDETLNADSTNAVSNAAVTAKLNEVERATIAGMDAQLSEDEQTVTLKLTNRQGGEVASVDLPAGGKGGGGEQQTTRIILSASVSQSAVKAGDSSQLTYTYRHVSADNAETPTGVQATIRLVIRRGATQLLEQTIPDVSAGTYTLDLTPYLTTAGTVDVQILATAVNAEGKTQKRTIATSVAVYALSLASSYSLSSGLPGYATSDILAIPYAVTGVGNKTITLYIDGVSHSVQSVTRAGTTNGTFQVPLQGATEGRHTAQLIAELTIGSKEIKSESIYFDYYVGKSEDLPRIGVMLRRRDGHIHTAEEHLSPRLDAEQFASYAFNYALFDPQRQPAELSLKVGDAEPLSLSLGRGVEEYSSRSAVAGDLPVRLSTRLGVTYDLTIAVREGHVNVGEVTDGVTLALSALGRSNSEANPARWMNSGIATIFRNFDWAAGGWDGSSLRLVNGSAITIPATFFSTDPMGLGGTIELELRTDSVLSASGAVVSCVDDKGIGFVVTGKQAELRTASGAVVVTKFATGEFYRIAFVIQPKSGSRLLELYINGIRSGAVSYGQADTLLQVASKPIDVTSEHADVRLRAVRLYNRALSDDELLSNYTASRPDASEVVKLFERNDVLGDDGAISMDKLRRQGKSVLRIVGNVPLVNETNTKKFEVSVDIYFYSGFGKQYDFICKGAGLRIQGTSSTTYPRKNYRIYLDRKKKYNTTLIVGGVEQQELKYAFTPGAVPVSVFTIKADFAESSSTHNTGLAKLIDETFRRAGILTPPQKTSQGVRIAIDGFPMDAFFDLDGSGKNTYLGKYNFNNDKSGSEEVFGFVKDDKCMCLEFLNNSEPLALFATDNMATFKTALEFRHPDGVEWDTASEAQKTAVRRLWKWIVSCKGNATKFKREVADYFDVESLTGWYVLTEYFMMVDQRAKNMMLATWDGLRWHFLPYDNDIIFGKRNDGVLIYNYMIDENTFDETIGSYAYAGHDSLLWQLVREALPDKLQETAQKIRATMSKERVLEILNGQFMHNWSERVYNKDGEYKYLEPYTTRGIDYLYCLQGSRYAHRTAMINDRFSLLDAKYLAGTYRADALRLYFSHQFSSDRKRIGITASEHYYFGYGYTSKAPHVSGVRADGTGSQVSLELDIDLIINDPQNIYGASRMAELDLSDVSAYIVGTANFDKCYRLTKLNVSCATGQTTLTAVTVGACRVLEELSVAGLRSPSFRSLDLTGNPRLKRLDASNTVLTDIVLANGAPITELRVPETLTTLRLRYLPKLTKEGLVGLHPEAITRLWYEGCPQIDWEALLEQLTAVTHLRIVGIDRTGDVAWLNRFLTKGGISASGSLTTTCALVGTYRLTQFLTDVEYDKLAAHFPELSIRQPEYTIVGYVNRTVDKQGFPQEVLATDRWFNHDNQTGFGFDKPYTPSGHLLRIFKARHRWRGREEKRGEMVVYPLRDDHFGYYADGLTRELSTATDLADPQEGGVWVNEPHYWYKGIHDGETGTDYQVYSSLLDEPRRPEGKLYDLQGIESELKPVLQHYIQCPKGSEGKNITDCIYKYRAAYTNENNCNVYSYIKIPVKGFKRVKFPLCNNGYSNSDDPRDEVPHQGYFQPAPYDKRFKWERACMISAVFTDADGKILKVIRLSNEEYPLFVLDYVAAIPHGATHLYTSVFTEFIDSEMEIWLTNSTNPADWEPHWQEHKETWIAAVPMHWQQGESLPELTIGEQKKLGKQDLMKFKFLREHGMYDQLSYEEYKDLRNLLWAHVGNFKLRDIYGWGIGDQENDSYFTGFYSLPEAGMTGTTARNLQGKISTTPGLILQDSNRNPVYKTCSCPTVFGYIWLPNRMLLTFSTFSKDGVFCAHSKNDGVRGAVTTRRDHANLGFAMNDIMWLREWRHFGGVERRIHPLGKYERKGYAGDKAAMQVVGGRYMDVVTRKNGGSTDVGCCMRNLFGELLNDNEIYATDSDWWGKNTDGGMGKNWSWERQFVVPVFRGKVIKASSPEELRKHKHYKFLLEEKPDLSKW